MRPEWLLFRCAAALLVAGLSIAGRAAPEPVLEAAVFYASFDETLRADFGAGPREVRSRFNHETEPGRFVFEDGFDASVFRIAPAAGVHGGALEATGVLPRNGRIFFPARGNLPYRSGGWGGAVSFWLKTNPDTMLRTRFCDPVQITEKGATNGGLWVDFPDTSPRDLRLGAFSSVAPGRPAISESDPDAPLVRVAKVGFQAADWHHVAFTWSNFDTGRRDARAALYIDSVLKGELSSRAVTMDWDLAKTGIYIAVNYVGLLDELAVFSRPLAPAEISRLHREPGLLAPLKHAR
jgi:hypothetical protein